MTHLIHIGNSLGIRIPKVIINQLGFNEETPLRIEIVDEGLLIAPVRSIRQGWDKAFKKRKRKEKLLINDRLRNDFDNDEWEW